MGIFSRFLGNGAKAYQQGHGVDPTDIDGAYRPFETVFRNGIFSGYDGSWWKYYACPENVKVEWNQDPMDAVHNQNFFREMTRDFADRLVNRTTKTKNDNVRSAQCLFVSDISDRIIPPPGSTPATIDYIERMSNQFSRPVWSNYIGIKLNDGGVYAGVQRATEVYERAKEYLLHPELFNVEGYVQDIAEADEVMVAHGFRLLDFRKNPEDFYNLSAFFSDENESYGIEKRIQTTRTQEPKHGFSIITPKYGEITVFAVKAEENNFIPGAPQSNSVRWSDAVFHPMSQCVAASIRFDIHSSKVTGNIFSRKTAEREDMIDRLQSLGIADNYQIKKELQDTRKMEIAQESAANKNPLLGNTEIMIASKIVPGEKHRLPEWIRDYGLEAVPVVGRQPEALMSMLPTYPKRIAPINGKEGQSELSNQVMPGVIGLSGLFRKTKPCAESGIILGLSDDHEYREIYTDVEAASKHSSVPGILITGRPGSGKTQQCLQIAKQLVCANYRSFFLNPKKDATLSPFFEDMNGYVISMDEQYLADNPAIIDPMFFYDHTTPSGASKIQQVLAEAIIKGVSYNIRGKEGAFEVTSKRVQIESELSDNIADVRNTCSYHVVFGNGKDTKGISNQEVKDVLMKKISFSPFWNALLGAPKTDATGLRTQLLDGRPVLVEWGSSLQLPEPSESPSDWTERNVDSLLSVSIMFHYASNIIGESRNGGAIIIDEAWVLKTSESIMSILKKGGREWRQSNIALILSTQRIRDFYSEDIKDASDELSQYFARYLFMANSGESELSAFYDITKLTPSKQIDNYLKTAGVKNENKEYSRSIPKAIYMDNIEGWMGGIICGPFPTRELNLGRTDREGELARMHKNSNKESSDYNGSLGDLGLVYVEDNEDIESSLSEVRSSKKNMARTLDKLEEQKSMVKGDFSGDSDNRKNESRSDRLIKRRRKE